jgi:DNA-binding MarR family transcriptional regulator
MPDQANQSVLDNDLVVAAIVWLRERLPASWTVEPSPVRAGGDNGLVDSAVDVRGGAAVSTIIIEARRSMGPRDVERLLGGLGRKLRQHAPYFNVLVVAPWLSPRTRALLAADGMNYVDLTGNALVRLENPGVYIQTEGAARDPSPVPRGTARLGGRKAARVIRALLDVSPPYGVSELARATGLTPGYVSRLLDALDQDALIERSKRGRVETVDLAGLLRRWAQTYDLLKTNAAESFLAARGAQAALDGLERVRGVGQRAVTGSFAAVKLVAVAAPALLAVYCEQVAAVAEALELLPADQGANVVLLQPFDPVVFERVTDGEDGVPVVSPSQVAVDCLTGTGRMPAEGQALLDWMLANESVWRTDSLEAASA